MSDTKVDMPKVAQMLDAGWHVRLYKGPMGSYEVRAHHDTKMEDVRNRLIESMSRNKSFLREMKMGPEEAVEFQDFHDGWLMTDDFTPEQALTRMAYKVHGEILL